MAALTVCTTLIQALEQAFKEPIIQLLVGPAQARTTDRLAAQVVAMASLGVDR